MKESGHSLAFKGLIVLSCLCGLVAFAAEKLPRPGVPGDSSPQPNVRGAMIMPRPAGLPKDYKLLYEQNFEKPEALQDFSMTDPDAWKIARTNHVTAMELTTQSKYTPAVRSPFNIALISDKVFTDFVLEADLIQTGKEYGHRDMCLFFGMKDPSKFYYAHIATAADDHAHNIFVVNDQPRTKIAKETTKGVNWGLCVWHKVRLERKASDGSIKVYFDNMAKPIMVAEDKTFDSGYVGFGSFDDTGMIDNIKIWGPSAQTKKTEFFKKSEK